MMAAGLRGDILAPAATLVIWTVVMLVWMLVVTGNAFRKAGLDAASSPPGSRGQDLTGKIPEASQWPAHNYMHLLEQPTAFYAIVLILGLTGHSWFDVVLAWLYVLLRIGHSVWQASVNRIPVRFALFMLSTLCLALLAVRALVACVAT